MLGEDDVWLPTASELGGHDARVTKIVDEALHKSVRPGLPSLLRETDTAVALTCQYICCTGCLNHILVSATAGKNIHIWCIGDEGRFP